MSAGGNNDNVLLSSLGKEKCRVLLPGRYTRQPVQSEKIVLSNEKESIIIVTNPAGSGFGVCAGKAGPSVWLPCPATPRMPVVRFDGVRRTLLVSAFWRYRVGSEGCCIFLVVRHWAEMVSQT